MGIHQPQPVKSGGAGCNADVSGLGDVSYGVPPRTFTPRRYTPVLYGLGLEQCQHIIALE